MKQKVDGAETPGLKLGYHVPILLKNGMGWVSVEERRGPADGGLLGDFPGNRDYPRKSLLLAEKSFFSMKVATYLDKAVTTFPENTTCLEKHDFLSNRC